MKAIGQISVNDHAIKRLTALWALSESGLGGIMFALKIPFTGFLLGAIAVIILSLIARFSGNDARRIIGATIIVLIVKASVSPHSPFPAYLAVSFQGLVAAFLFRFISSHKTACVLLGIITMVESALQKVIVLTLIFGRKIWEAIDSFIAELGKTFSVNTHHSYALWLVGIYVMLYLIWGIVVGLWAAGIFKQVEKRREITLKEFIAAASNVSTAVEAAKRPALQKRFIIFGIMLAFIVTVFVLTGAGSRQLLWIFARSIAAILLLFVVLRPVVQFAMKRWLSRRSANQQQAAADVISILPQMRTFVKSAYQIALPVQGYFKRMRSFFVNVIILSLYAE